MTSSKKNLAKIDAQIKQWYEDGHYSADAGPASQEALDFIKEYCEILRIENSAALVHLYSQVNGGQFNGTFIYAIEEIPGERDDADLDEGIPVGRDSLSMYVMKPGNRFHLVNLTAPDEVYEEFATAEEMILGMMQDYFSVEDEDENE